MIKWWYVVTFLWNFIKHFWYDFERKLEDYKCAKESLTEFPKNAGFHLKKEGKRKRCHSYVVSHWEFERWARSSHLSTSSIISLKQTSATQIFSLSAPFHQLFSPSLFQTRSDCGTVEDCERDDQRSDSHCVCLAACVETLCVSVWNNSSGCLEEIFFFG